MTFFEKRITFDLLRTWTIIALRRERGMKSNGTIKITDLDTNLQPIHWIGYLRYLKGFYKFYSVFYWVIEKL